jgi:hypothetical protein
MGIAPLDTLYPLVPAPIARAVSTKGGASSVGSADQGVRGADPGQDLRPALDLRLQCAGGRRLCIPARPDHGASVRMIGRHYGAMLDGSSAEIATQLDALDAAQDRDGEALLEDG